MHPRSERPRAWVMIMEWSDELEKKIVAYDVVRLGLLDSVGVGLQQAGMHVGNDGRVTGECGTSTSGHPRCPRVGTTKLHFTLTSFSHLTTTHHSLTGCTFIAGTRYSSLSLANKLLLRVLFTVREILRYSVSLSLFDFHCIPLAPKKQRANA